MKTKRRDLTSEEQADAQRLRKVWEEKSASLKLTQLSVSKSFGFANQSAVSQYLNARIPLNLETAAKFSKVLGVPLEDISPRHAKSVFDHASVSFNMAQFESGQSTGLVPEGCIVVETSCKSHPDIGECRWYVVNPVAKILHAGVYLAEVDGKDSVVKVTEHPDGFAITGLAKAKTVVSPEIAALLHIKGQILYKIFKV
jgi:hypothetical protein